MGHPEYDRLTLEKEYHRDLAKGFKIQAPENYFLDSSHKKINYNWRSSSELIYQDWLNKLRA